MGYEFLYVKKLAMKYFSIEHDYQSISILYTLLPSQISFLNL